MLFFFASKHNLKYESFVFFFLFSLLLLTYTILNYINQSFYFISLIFIFFVKNEEFRGGDRVLVLGISLFIFAYTLWASFPYIDILNNNIYLKFSLFLFIYFVYLVFILKINSFFIISLVVLLLFKNYININYVTVTSKTDYQTLINVLIFAKIFFSTKFFLNKAKIKFNSPNFLHLSICLHLLNYFFSGIKKLNFDTFYFWITQNNLFNLIDFALIGQFNPFPDFFFNTHVFKYINLYEGELSILLSIFTIIPQLLVPIAFFKTRMIPFFLVFFEIQHLVIYIISGIFFYKWIFLNILFLYIYYNFAQVRGLASKSIFKIIILISYLVIFSISFTTVSLGWLDSYVYHKDFIQVELKNKKKINLPSSFFLASSLPYTQSRFFSDLYLKKSGSLGATQSSQFFKETKNCNIQLIEKDKFNLSITHPILKQSYQFNKKILEQNTYLRENIYNVFYYPHHVFQNRKYYKNLKGISLSDFDKIYFVRQVYCKNSYNNIRLIKTYKIFLDNHDKR